MTTGHHQHGDNATIVARVLASSLRRSLVVERRVRKHMTYRRFSKHATSNDGVFSVDIESGIGMFAQLVWCVYIFAHCDQNGLRPHIRLSGANYRGPGRDRNWFGYHFDNIGLSDLDRHRINSGEIATTKVRFLAEVPLDREFDKELTLERANELVNKYVGIRPEVLDKVVDFRERNATGSNTLGVHYRGTDKASEAPRVPREACRDAVRTYLKDHPNIDGVFVASDEQSFIDYLVGEVREVPIHAHPDDFRSTNGHPIHALSTGSPGDRKGAEALINCLLLSSCSAVVRTSSFLSAYSSVFNPNLDVVLLNRPFKEALWFPESAIVSAIEAPAARGQS